MVAPMKTRPPAVAIEPPRFGAPSGSHIGNGAWSRVVPSRRLPEQLAALQIDRLQHAPRRRIARRAERSEQRRDAQPVRRAAHRAEHLRILHRRTRSSSSNSARGISCTTLGTRIGLTKSTPRAGSIETPPQFGPPALPGYWMIGSRPGGVKIPSERMPAIFSAHCFAVPRREAPGVVGRERCRDGAAADASGTAGSARARRRARRPAAPAAPRPDRAARRSRDRAGRGDPSW